VIVADLLTAGVDTYCVDELKPGRIARGTRLLAQRLYHRLITPTGDLIGGDEEADFGLDLTSVLGSTNSRDTQMLPVRIENELLKDPAVDSVKVTPTREDSGGSISWTFTIAVQSAIGPFDFIVTSDGVTVAMLGVT
jgi:hypothetical protein